MKASTRNRLAAAIAAAAFGLGACATDGQGEGTSAGQYIDDATLTAKVKTALATDVGMGTAAAINVETYRGVVQLTGFVDTAQQKQQAMAAAKAVDGVRSIKNNIVVKDTVKPQS